jgi:hypothetical protein
MSGFESSILIILYKLLILPPKPLICKLLIYILLICR